MSTLREKVVLAVAAAVMDGGYHHGSDYYADCILALAERECVERERKAFMASWMFGNDNTSTGEVLAEVARRYPLPKEE